MAFEERAPTDKRKYANHADALFTVFEMLRNELAAESDDSAVLGRLHEIASLPAADFFAALSDLATGLPTHADLSVVLSRCSSAAERTRETVDHSARHTLTVHAEAT